MTENLERFAIMEFQNTMAESTYRLGWFRMSEKNGNIISAVAVTRKEGIMWGSSYTILTMFIFTAVGVISYLLCKPTLI